MATCSKETLIKIDELPVINGVIIDSIYAYKRDDEMYRTRDAHLGEVPDFYNCNSYFSSKPSLLIKTLPKEFADLFGKQSYNGKVIDIHSIWYRTSNSGNGSFTDDSMDISGSNVIGNTGGSFSLFRGIKDLGIDSESDLAKRMLNTLNKKYTAEVCKEWEYKYFPCTHLRNVGGLNYPDTAIPSWRWLRGMPYVSYDNCKTMRVYLELMNAHVYLEKVNPEVGDEELIQVNFPSSWDKEPDYFCNVSTWADTKEGAANEMIRWRIDKVEKDGDVQTSAMVNGKPQFKRRSWSTSFYRLVNYNAL